MRLTHYFLLFLFLVIVAGTIGHFSYCAPRQIDKEASYRKQEEADARCRADIACKPLTRATADARAKQAEEEEKNKDEYMAYCGGRFKITDFLLALFTGVLVIVGVGQAVYIREAIVADRDSREILEDCYIYGGGDNQTGIPGYHNKLVINIHNYGRTPVFLKEIKYGFCDDGQLPPKAIYPFSIPWADSIGPNQGHQRTARIDWDWSRDQIIWGQFVFDDIFGRERTVSFIQKVGPSDPLPVPIKADASYTSRTEPPSRWERYR